MLRTLGLLSTATVLLFCFSQNASADEYGERFYNNTPAGMAEFTLPDETVDIAMDDAAADLQDIMPAAGEEADASSEPEVIDNINEEQEATAEISN